MKHLLAYTRKWFLWGEWGDTRKENTICTEIGRVNSCFFPIYCYLLSRSDLLRPYIFSFSKILVTFAILDNAFEIIPSSKMWLWLLMGHKTYYLISTHGKKRINEGSCMPRMNLIVYISSKTCIVTPWSSGVQGRYLEGSRSGIIFLLEEVPQWELARKHAIIMLYGGVGDTIHIFT